MGKNLSWMNLSVNIPEGLITVIIGFSGTGKSVLMRHILGLEQPTSGSVKVLNKEISDMRSEELTDLRCQLGVLFQHAALFDDMTCVENVCFPLTEHRPMILEEEAKGLAKTKLITCGIAEKDFYKLPSELSGGMRKRVGLARALILDPKILFYDEPTTGLDPILTEMVDNLILDTHNQLEGSTSVVITHDLEAGFRIGDNIVMLNQGKILLEGTPEEFKKSEIDLVKRFLAKGFGRRTRGQ